MDIWKYMIKVQGGNDVCFFIADLIFVPKFLILDTKSVTNSGP